MLTNPSPCSLDPVGAVELASASTENWFPFDRGEGLVETFFGTGAVYQAVKDMDLQEGDAVLLPSYNCGHEIEPVLRAGARVAFYEVDRSASINLEHLKSQCTDDVRAILVTHYFGFPQQLDKLLELCHERDVKLIEDCAHALFSSDGNEPLGSRGDYAVFSFRKSLPLGDGGGLLRQSGAGSMPLEKPPWLSVFSKSWRLRHKSFVFNRPNGVSWSRRLIFSLTWPLAQVPAAMMKVLSLFGIVQHNPDDERFDFPGLALSWSMSARSNAIMRDVSGADVLGRRRTNFLRLLEIDAWSKRMVPLYPEIPPGVCPLYFPVRCCDTEGLLERLAEHSLPAVPWWEHLHPAVPWEEFDAARQLKESIVAIPVHQELRAQDMDAYAAVLSAHTND